MSLADLAALRALIANPDQILRQAKFLTISDGKSNRWVSSWTKGLHFQGTAPSTAAVVDNTTAGAWSKVDAGSGRQIILGGDLRLPTNTPVLDPPPTMMIIDRLSHQGGLVGNVITSQTTNLPTAALTRYTSGVGVMAAVEVYTALGGTASQLDMTYTNSAGTGSRVGSLVLQAADPNAAGWFTPVPLAAGDLGVRSVESVQLTVSTATAGNFGITLFKPVGFIIVSADGHHDNLNNAMWGEEILDGACLQPIIFGANNATFVYSLALAEC